jgi:CRISPR-associated protein Csd2
MMSARGLYVFKHETALGNAPAHQLFDLITVKRKQDGSVPRDFSDYEVAVNQSAIPKNVTLSQMI